MMRRETAYKLAGRNHQHGDALADSVQHHDLRLAALPLGQRQTALRMLQDIPHLKAEASDHPCGIRLCYDLAHHHLAGIESLLESQGIRLDNSLVSRLKRSLVRFVEETQVRNASSPQRLIKQSNQVYVKAYEHHPHGDRDETPPELREFK
ncbi:MAG: hypothetical protein BSR46_16880 [Candidatus Dactylopiibacterium carminicum]|uniref:hypothetical protein n=1 Tax=Candidatus Dactylopiibacterium carminicum TaxID=857335 RepID=UPI000BDA4B96|nr:hypothetical protein [Candidatus Dactylopiibacterium carminicum]PAS95525.1 MAG: hypothetical protein BSR46_16880 [Candidatus Dactylopiibacterium carminicum]